MVRRLRILTLATPMLVMPALAQTPVDTTFTYQGRLDAAGAPATGSHDLQFRLFDAAVGGAQVGPPICYDNRDLVDGLFTVALDFGAEFTGEARWIEVGVRADAGELCFNGAYTTLAPRQPLTAAPYAIHALNAGQWQNSGSAITNTNTGFVGINRDYTVGLEWFGVHAPVNSGYGGMYVTTEGDTARPFYGYRSANGQVAWTYLDGETGDWHVNVDGNRLTVTDEGLVGIRTASPSHPLHVVTTNTDRAIYAENSTNVGAGVRGKASHATGSNFGVYGETASSSGTAVFGIAAAASGETKGIWGKTTSADGFGGYFEGMGYFSGNVGIGTSSPANILDVVRNVTSESDVRVSNSTAGGAAGFFSQSDTSTCSIRAYSATYPNTNLADKSALVAGSTSSGLVLSASGSAAGIELFTGAAPNNTVRMKIDASGNVGLGTTSPTNPLSVVGDADITGRVSIGITGADARLLVRGTVGEDAFRVRVDTATKVVVKDNGGVGIGSNFGTVPDNGMRIAGAVGIGADPGAFTLVSNGDAAKPGGGSWSNFSDARLKRDIEPIAPGMLDRLLTLKGYTFEYVEDAIENRLGLPGRQTGLIAQEVKAVFPDWVAADDEGYLYVTERGLTAIVVEALRELRAERDAAIDALKADNEELRQRVDQLAATLAQLAERCKAVD